MPRNNLVRESELKAKYPTIDVSGLDPAAVIAGLWNAQCQTLKRQTGRVLMDPEDVQLAYRQYRESAPNAANEGHGLWCQGFLRGLLGTEFEVVEVSLHGPSVIRVWSYDKRNGWGRAQEVIDHLFADKGWDTRPLARRQSYGPLILLVASAIFACFMLYSRIGGLGK